MHEIWIHYKSPLLRTVRQWHYQLTNLHKYQCSTKMLFDNQRRFHNLLFLCPFSSNFCHTVRILHFWVSLWHWKCVCGMYMYMYMQLETSVSNHHSSHHFDPKEDNPVGINGGRWQVAKAKTFQMYTYYYHTILLYDTKSRIIFEWYHHL